MKISRERAELFRRIAWNLGDVLSGRVPEHMDLYLTFWGALARYLFGKIHEAYKVKSQGRMDELGNSWPALSPQTIANRRVTEEDILAYGIGGTGERAFKRRVRGLLTVTQDKQWRAIYAKTLAKLEAVGTPSPEAKQGAAKLAWAILKSRGAQTRLEVLGGRVVLINVDTGALLASFDPTPGEGPYTARDNQLFELNGGSAELGSNIPYADDVDSLRSLIPDNAEEWVDEAIEAGLDAMVPILEDKV